MAMLNNQRVAMFVTNVTRIDHGNSANLSINTQHFHGTIPTIPDNGDEMVSSNCSNSTMSSLPSGQWKTSGFCLGEIVHQWIQLG